MKSSNIGGQAVMEGIMMRHGDVYSVAVRKPDKEIEIKVEDYKSIIKNKKILSLPIRRGLSEEKAPSGRREGKGRGKKGKRRQGADDPDSLFFCSLFYSPVYGSSLSDRQSSSPGRGYGNHCNHC